MPRRGRRRKKSRTHVDESQNEKARSALVGGGAGSHDAAAGADGANSKVPRSIVFRRGKRTEAEVGELVQDVRHLMAPFTALSLQENRQLTLSQYAKHLALPMGVTHMLSFSQNDERLWLKLARTPDGPTLTFRVRQFTLRRHIVRTQRRPVSLHTPALHANPPIVVTNNFESGAGGAAPSASRPHLKLLRITFQNLFPATNVHTVKLRECKRLALFHYDPEADLVQVRHYAITSSLRDAAALAAAATAAASPSSSGGGGAAAAGQRRLRRIVSSRSKLPNLSRLSDIADLLDDGAAVSDGAATSDSELEDEGGDDDDGGSASAAAPASASPSLASSSSSSALSRAVKLKEVGPRLTLQLVKVERGLAGGDVLYHAHERRSADEAARLRERKEREARGREERRAAQRANVDRKRAAADERRLAKKQRRQGRGDPGPSTALPHGEGQEEDEEGSEAGSSPEEGGEGYGSEEGARAPSSDEEYEGSDEGQE